MFMNDFLGDAIFDDIFDFGRPVRTIRPISKCGPAPRFNSIMTNVMKTDIKESDEAYELSIDLPGYSKDEVQAELKDGYMTIRASKKSTGEDTDEKSRYIRRERFYGSCSRSFYVGESVTESDISASFKDGILYVKVSKKQPAPEIEEKKLIQIEG